MWLVLCSRADVSALWAHEGLKQRAVAPLELVLSEELAGATLIDHRLDANGAQLKIGLTDGRVLSSRNIRGALNRLIAPSPDLIRHAVATDLEYAQAELHACYLSWLHGLPGIVINRPHPLGLCGAWRHPSEWACRAADAGFSVKPYRQSADPTTRAFPAALDPSMMRINVIALGDETFGASLPARVASSCSRLARAAGVELLGIELHTSQSGGWHFADATPMPALSIGGVPFLDRLAETLTQGLRG
jgi:hypothetical protein